MATIVRHGRRFNHRDYSDPLNHAVIGVLYGGPSAEREVSLHSGEAVAKALAGAGRTIQRVILDGSFDVRIARSLGIDVAFLALHGEFGEDGQVQCVLEEAGIPYTGSGPDASSLAFDKVLAKRAFERHGLLTPVWLAFDRPELLRLGGEASLDLAPPLVVKPAASGSSLGVTIARAPSTVAPALEQALRFGDSVLIERFVAGRELTVSVLGDEPLPVVELKPQSEFYDYEAKYHSSATGYTCPADLPRSLTARVQATALAAHRALACRDVSRTDLILDAAGLAWVLEVNTLPGLTSHSLLPKAADATGMSFTALCEFLLLRALARRKNHGTQAA